MPASSINVQDVYDTLGSLFRWTSVNDANLYTSLNLAGEQIVNSGSWDGCVAPIVFSGAPGYITLPYWAQSVMGVDINGWPRAVFSQFQQYNEMGIGMVSITGNGYGPLIDDRDGHPTQRDIKDFGASGTLKATIINPTDAVVAIRLFGLDASGNEIYDSSGNRGITLTTVNPSASTSQVFSEVTGIELPARMNGYWKLFVTIGGIDHQIGEYNPNELRPNYHRYLTGTWDATVPIACLCRLRPINVYAPKDFVVPGNMNAIKFALQAINAEESRNYKSAQEGWAQCYGLLNAEHRSRRGKAAYSVNINPKGPGQWPVMNTH